MREFHVWVRLGQSRSTRGNSTVKPCPCSLAGAVLTRWCHSPSATVDPRDGHPPYEGCRGALRATYRSTSAWRQPSQDHHTMHAPDVVDPGQMSVQCDPYSGRA